MVIFGWKILENDMGLGITPQSNVMDYIDPMIL